MQIIEMLEAKAEGQEAHRGLIVANDADYRRAHLTTSPYYTPLLHPLTTTMPTTGGPTLLHPLTISPYYIPLLHPLTTTMPTTGEPICWWRVRRGCVAHSL